MGSAKDFDPQSPTSSTPKASKHRFLQPSLSLARLPSSLTLTPNKGSKRWFSEDQRKVLTEAFDEDPNPSQTSMVKIAEKIDLTHGQVEVRKIDFT